MNRMNRYMFGVEACFSIELGLFKSSMQLCLFLLAVTRLDVTHGICLHE